MKKLLALATTFALILSVTPAVFAEDAAAGGETVPAVEEKKPDEAASVVKEETPVIEDAQTKVETSKDDAEAAKAEAAALKAKREAYKAAYTAYTNYYNNVYVPKYNAYNAALTSLANRIKAATNITAEQLLAIRAFLADIRAQRWDFYGDRSTVGKSRYVVPALRGSMTAAFDNSQYDEAMSLCSQLVAAVQARVGFLDTLISKIDGYVIVNPPAAGTGAVAFHATTHQNTSYYDFTITITNDSDKAIEGWELYFVYDGEISTVWANGSAMVLKQNNGSNGKKTIYPANKWQSVYTIPAHGSVTIIGNGNKIGTKVTDGSFMGENVDISFGIN